jgi:hypothetical protein
MIEIEHGSKGGREVREGVVRPPTPLAEIRTYLLPLYLSTTHTWLREQAFDLKTSLALQKSEPPTKNTCIV